MSEPGKPRAFRIDAPAPEPEAAPARPPARGVIVSEEPDPFAEKPAAPGEALLKPQPRPWSIWLKLFLSSLGGLISLAVGMWFWRLVDELYRASPFAGWFGAALVAVATLALVALVIREAYGLRSLAAVTELREAAADAFATDDSAKARAIVHRLIAMQAKDASTARQRMAMTDHLTGIIDGRDLLRLADRTLLHGRDELARDLIAGAAKRVSVVTAISPRAIVDILFVAAQSVMLTRRIAEVYGARPGTLGFLGLARRILTHLAVTGGVAISDSVLSQLVGQGLAARLSAKLGEGVLNGLLTARVGLAAVAACRPLPYLAGEEPRLQDVAGDILSNPLGRTD